MDDLWNVDSGKKISSSLEDTSAIRTVEVRPVTGEEPLLALRQGSQRNGFKAGAVRVWDAAADKSVAELPEVTNIPCSRALPVSAKSQLLAGTQKRDVTSNRKCR